MKGLEVNKFAATCTMFGRCYCRFDRYWKLISLSSNLNSVNSVVALDEKYHEIRFSSYFTYLGTLSVDFHV